MPFALLPLEKEDADEAARLITASYANNLFRKIIFPEGMSQHTIEIIVESRRKAVDDPDKYPLKVVDTETGKMAASAVWVLTKEMTDEDWDREKEEVPNSYPEARHDILDEFLLKEQDSKRRILGYKSWFELTALSTLPKYQRRGIGSKVMEWGINKMEELQVPGFIVSTDQGHGLYTKHGFKEMERWQVDMNRWPEFGFHGTYKNSFLIRELAQK